MIAPLQQQTATDEAVTQTETSFDRSSWAVLGLATLLLAFSILLTLHRLSLPSDGYDLWLESNNEQGLDTSGDATIVAVGEQPAAEILRRALTLQPQPPPGWQVGQRVLYRWPTGHTVVQLSPRPATVNLNTMQITYVLLLAIGVLVFVRRPRHHGARLLLLFPVVFIADEISRIPSGGWAQLSVADMFSPLAYWPSELFNQFSGTLAWIILLHFFLVFPTPKPFLMRHPWLVLGVIYGAVPALTLVFLAWHLATGQVLTFWSTNNVIELGSMILLGFGGMAALWHSFTSAHDPVVRAQMRWLALGAGVTFANVLVLILLIILSSLNIPVAEWMEHGANIIYESMPYTMLFLALTLAIAILRYRLFDIDVVINLALVYGTLTVALGVLYVGVITGAQLGLAQLGPGTQWASFYIALPVVGVLFVPLRRRLQAFADRRFPRPTRPPAAVPETIPQQATKAHRRLLRIARVGWFAAVGLAVTYLYALLATADIPLLISIRVEQWGNGVPGALREAAQAISVTLIVVPLCYWLVASVIGWRGFRDPIALFVSGTLVLFGAVLFGYWLIGSPNLAWFVRSDWRFHLQSLTRSSAWGCLLIFFLIFPDGRFVPSWSRWIALAWVLYAAAWIAIPGVDPHADPGPPIYLAMLFCVVISLGGQLFRSRIERDIVRRQQTKWIVLGFMVAFVGISSLLLLLLLMITADAWKHPLAILVAETVVAPLVWGPGPVPFLLFTIHNASFALIPITVAFAVLRYRLFDIDFIISRALIYGSLTAALGLAYIASVVLLQAAVWDSGLSAQLTSTPVVVLSTLAIAALFSPLRRRIQRVVDRRFYRDQVDFRTAFTAFTQEIRTIISLPDLLHVLVVRTTDLLHIAHGALFLRAPDGGWMLAEAANLPPGAAPQLQLDDIEREQLMARSMVKPADGLFALLIPLTAPNAQLASSRQFIGVLALGPRRSEQGYGSHEQALLLSLADQAGTAITVAQLVIEQQAEAERYLAAERHLAAHRASPLGRAEQLAQELIAAPNAALHQLWGLAQQAYADAEAQQILEHLPRVFEIAGVSSLAQIAEGYRYLVVSHANPELLPVGLRTLVAGIADLEGGTPSDSSARTRAVYEFCQRLLEVDTTQQIVALMPLSQATPHLQDDAPGAELVHTLDDLRSIADTLRPLGQVAAAEDRLSYLASALEQLSRTATHARTALGAADRAIAEQIVERWLGIVTRDLREVHIRPRVTCSLLTHRAWRTERVTLLLNVRNTGRGAAEQIAVSIIPGPGYRAPDQPISLPHLAPGEETQLELALHAPPQGSEDPLRLRWSVRYTDVQGGELIEQFADVVTLLDTPSEFRMIANPYVLGTPLRAGSPLFVGREDLVRFIQEHLAAVHSNNLVLIGQRRTGKTSLLKQLPTQLDDTALPIYLDGQALGLDPGLANFFLTLATEIAYALEAADYAIAHPTLDDFAASPARAFERGFLTQVRALLGERRLLLLLDEFEELEAAVQRGTLDASVFAALRHLMQHTPGLSVIFCGTHRLEELAAEYWSTLFNIAVYRHVGFLTRADAMFLICDPVAPAGLRYDDLALEKIWRVTAGHPYFLQLLCYTIVSAQNRQRRSYVTIDDVNIALDELLGSGEAHFIYLWSESSTVERLVLAALSRVMPLGGQIELGALLAELEARGAPIERLALDQALHRLALRDILAVRDGDRPERSYRWKLGLLGLWVERARTLSRVIEEVQR